MARPDAAAFIRDNLTPEPVAGLTGIRLYRAHPGSRVTRIAGANTPYWAYVWPGGLALARHFAEHPDCVAGKRVLDFGAGSGLVGIAAAKAGASTVICSEADASGRAAIAVNAALNGVSVEIAGDVTGEAPPVVDLVAAGDTFYDPQVAKTALAFLRRMAEAGASVLVGDIGRKDLPQEELERVAAYPVRDFGDSADAVLRQGYVHRLR